MKSVKESMTGMSKTSTPKGVYLVEKWDYIPLPQLNEVGTRSGVYLHIEHHINMVLTPVELEDLPEDFRKSLLDKLDRLLELTLNLTVYSQEFNKSLSYDRVIEFLSVSRREILSSLELREDKFLSILYKRVYKRRLKEMAKNYYTLCREHHKEYVNSFVEKLCVFSPMENTLYIYEK